MEARLNLFASPVAAKFGKQIVAAGKALADSTLPAATQELVKLRASQINGCGFCTDMHTKDAAHAGETSTRLNLVAAWNQECLAGTAGAPHLHQHTPPGAPHRGPGALHPSSPASPARRSVRTGNSQSIRAHRASADDTPGPRIG
ncbi:carboxymuconolactone decarboxylase family protein [Streptomyces sp. NRRL B-24720]|uniref:carboxymuconolactone decarboxylase family protein n=1 Tax=Streptomyces sp. NRRL B-24720 TaxID=1476876 RepID=UPI00099D2972|nr:carboxymuconolactone decarboxylase family protein [Streptomyces sp. NRRL B-24720]